MGHKRTGLPALLLLAVLALTPLSGCSYIATDTEDLLSPPILNTQQDGVYAALESTLNTATIVYKYPQSGEYRSPFIIYDMDGDGLDEAIVFYSYLTDTANTRFKVLRQDAGGVWKSFDDFSVAREKVDFVQFAPLLEKDSACLIIGWQSGATAGGRVESGLGIYSMVDGEFVIEVPQQSYAAYTVHDFDGNGLDEVVAVERNITDNTYRANLLSKTGGHIVTTAGLPLYTDADSILKMTNGRLWDGTGALYIDELCINSSVATEILRVTENGMETLVGGNLVEGETLPAWENYTDTWRDRDNVQLCRDVDGDGQVEVPYPVALTGTLADGEKYPLMLTQLMHITEEGFSIVSNAVINEAERYLVFYPDKWMERVTVLRDEESGEWKFSGVDADSGEPTTELLRIQAYSAQEALMRNTEGSIELDSRGTRHYSAYIPMTGDDALGITEQELHRMFLLLKD